LEYPGGIVGIRRLRPTGAGKEPLPVTDKAEIWAVVAALVRTQV